MRAGTATGRAACGQGTMAAAATGIGRAGLRTPATAGGTREEGTPAETGTVTGSGNASETATASGRAAAAGTLTEAATATETGIAIGGEARSDGGSRSGGRPRRSWCAQTAHLVAKQSFFGTCFLSHCAVLCGPSVSGFSYNRARAFQSSSLTLQLALVAEHRAANTAPPRLHLLPIGGSHQRSCPWELFPVQKAIQYARSLEIKPALSMHGPIPQEAEAKRDADLEAQMEAALGGEADDEDRLIEERRRRRQEILAKHQQQQQLSGGLGIFLESLERPTLLFSAEDCAPERCARACLVAWCILHGL